MMVKVPSDERDINVAAFADWLSVVDGFKNGKAPRMFLNLSRDRVEKARSLVSCEPLPDRKSCPRCFHRGVYIRCASLCDFGDSFAGRRIGGLEILCF